MPLYTVTENPPPFTNGETTVTTMDTDADVGFLSQRVTINRAVDFPRYRVVQFVPAKPPTTIVNTTQVTNITNINAQGNVGVSAEYFNTLTQANVSSRMLLLNNGGGTDTYDDNPSPIWNTAAMRIEPSTIKEVLDVSLRFKITTDTLGGAFEVEAFSNVVIDVIEEEVNIQQQDFTIRFKLVADQRAVDQGIYFYITPELGMTISIEDYSLLIVGG